MSDKIQKLSAQKRLELLFDNGDYAEIASELRCSARAAFGSVGGAQAYAYCQDSTDNAGAFDSAAANKLIKVYELAAKTGMPVITVYDSKGVELENGFSSLKASSVILKKSSELSGVVPQIAIVLGACGGFMSVAAALADFCVMADGAEMYLTPAFVDRANNGDEKEVGSAEFALRSGVACIVRSGEEEAINAAKDILCKLPINNLEALPVCDFAEPEQGDPGTIEGISDLESAAVLFPGLGKHTRTALATMAGIPCGIVEIKGRMCRHDTAKCARFIAVCDSFNIPVVTLVDSDGFKLSAQNDVLGGIASAAKLSHSLSEVTSAKICVVTGSAVGSAYSVLCGENAGNDLTYAWRSAVISPVTPEAAAGLLMADRIEKSDDIAALAAEYASTTAGAEMAAAVGAVDSVIEPSSTRSCVIAALDMLSSKRVSSKPKKHGNMPL